MSERNSKEQVISWLESHGFNSGDKTYWSVQAPQALNGTPHVVVSAAAGDCWIAVNNGQKTKETVWTVSADWETPSDIIIPIIERALLSVEQIKAEAQ